MSVDVDVIGRPKEVLRSLMLCSLAAVALSCAWLSCAWTSSANAASVSGVAWDVAFIAQPTDLPLTAYQPGEPRPQYLLMLTNTGKAASSGGVSVTVTLPAGGTLGRAAQGTGWECPTSIGSPVVTCSYGSPIAGLGRSGVLTIPVAISGLGAGAAQVEISGGGGPATVVSRSSNMVGSPSTLAPFGFTTFSTLISSMSGLSDTQAGDHPFGFTAIIDFPQREIAHIPVQAVKSPRAIDIDLPAGIAGTVLAAPRCPIADVLASACPRTAQIGTFIANYEQGLFSGGGEFPIYNVVPERGYPAEFGFFASSVHKVVFVYVNVRATPEYGLRVSIPDLPREIVTNAAATFFGDPQTMDGGTNASIPLLTNPSSCSGTPLVTTATVVPWGEPENRQPGESIAPPITGCERLQFSPSVSVAPNNMQADEPTGYNIGLKVPQSQTQGMEGLATADVKNIEITLPEGVSLSPGAGDGLGACAASGEEGIELTSTAPGHCPLSSQIGTVEGHTPLLGDPLEGHLYVAQPGCGGEGQQPCTSADATNGTLFGAYLELEDDGAIIKQRATLSANPATGQLTASIRNAPQFPFEDITLTVKDGPRAPIANPLTCGGALSSGDITPWSTPHTPDVIAKSPFTVDGCAGFPFAPALKAGSMNTEAGAYTTFVASFARADREQTLGSVQAHLPPGLLATIAHVTRCGEEAATRNACPASSRIGTVAAAVGAGSHPLTVAGPAYLTGPYKGAPFGLLVAIPAQAGPFNLGTVTVRATLNVDPVTAAAIVTSDPLPQIFDGVPLRVQRVNVTVDHPQFMFNPTNCEAKQITATLAAAQGASEQVSYPFAAGGCKNLPFNPGFKIATRAPGSKKRGTSLNVTVTSTPGQANIRGATVTLPKQLPARLTTLQQACPEATFAANPATCPIGSNVGVATAVTPVLDEAVSGPAILVSHGGAAFPDLVVILQGEGIRLDLVGNTNIRKGVTTSTFAAIPDAPVTSFALRLPEGPHSALTPNGNLCAKPLAMGVVLTGQNARKLTRSVKLSVAGCAAKRKPAKPKKKRRG